MGNMVMIYNNRSIVLSSESEYALRKKRNISNEIKCNIINLINDVWLVMYIIITKDSQF